MNPITMHARYTVARNADITSPYMLVVGSERATRFELAVDFTPLAWKARVKPLDFTRYLFTLLMKLQELFLQGQFLPQILPKNSTQLLKLSELQEKEELACLYCYNLIVHRALCIPDTPGQYGSRRRSSA